MLLLYCRAGFETDCASELAYWANRAGAGGRCDYRVGDAYVSWSPAKAEGRGRRVWIPDFTDLVFARQCVAGCELIDDPGEQARAAAVVATAKGFGRRFASVWFEAPDNDRARVVFGKRRGAIEHIEAELREAGIVGASRRGPRLHVGFLDATRIAIGESAPENSAAWPMGIPRLRHPAGAPSRSALKLVEALETFIGERDLPQRMRAGRVAIDLGAAPGGWSRVLASHGVRVLAVDNGTIAAEVLATELVEHRRADAFRYRPELPVDWMVCDVVAAPARIAALAAQWVARGWCRETIFNLKLPNRDRWSEVLRCHDVIERALAKSEDRHALRVKHLYHDREEVTAHLRRL